MRPDEELTRAWRRRCRAGVITPFDSEQINIREACRSGQGRHGHHRLSLLSLDLPYAGLTALREGAASLRGASLSIGN